MNTNVGILGIGIHLPPNVRTNEWWPARIVERWESAANEKVAAHMTGRAVDDVQVTDGVRKVQEAIGRYASDPFRGSVQRRVADERTGAFEMARRAAAEALERSGLAPDRIDCVLTFDLTPDYLNAPNGAALVDELGLNKGAFVSEVDQVCNSFNAQLAVAEGLIASGRCQNALLVTTSARTRMTMVEDPGSAWFGDGACAAVVSRVSAHNGILGWCHRSDGSLRKCLVDGVPGRAWYQDGHVQMYTEDRAASRRMLLLLADRARDTIDAALKAAGVDKRDIAFFAGHQSTRWMLEVLQDHAGLRHARSFETFSWAGTLSGANIPLAVGMAEREGLLKEGDLVVTFTPGTGMTYSSCVLRWGR